MAVVYFDASAFVKLVVEEEGTDVAVQLWDGCDAAVSSRLADVEVRAALAAAARNHQLTADDHRRALGQWDAYWAGVRPVELTASVQRWAGGFVERHALRGADAVHLASAGEVHELGVVLAARDKRLADAARSLGFAVAPA